jgi:hypothetical protein
MLCPACGQETSAKGDLCQHCGQNVLEALEAKVSGDAQVSADQPSGRRTLLIPASPAKACSWPGAGPLAFCWHQRWSCVFGGLANAERFFVQLAAILTWFTPMMHRCGGGHGVAQQGPGASGAGGPFTIGFCVNGWWLPVYLFGDGPQSKAPCYYRVARFIEPKQASCGKKQMPMHWQKSLQTLLPFVYPVGCSAVLGLAILQEKSPCNSGSPFP